MCSNDKWADSATYINVASFRLRPAGSVTTQLGSRRGVCKQPCEHLLEWDVAERLSILAGVSAAHGITFWARICLLERATEQTTVSHACANDVGLWDCHIAPDFCMTWATIVRRNERAKQLDHAFELALHVHVRVTQDGDC